MNRLMICSVVSGLGMLARGSISSVIVAVIQPKLPTTEETVADPGLGPPMTASTRLADRDSRPNTPVRCNPFLTHGFLIPDGGSLK